MKAATGQRRQETVRERTSRSSKEVRPESEQNAYFDEEDFAMNESLHGDYFEDSERDVEDDAIHREEGEDSYEDEDAEFEESSEQQHEEGSDSSESGTEVSPSVKEIVRNINQIAIGVVESGTMQIGEYVLKEVFKNKIEDVLSKNPNKTESLRSICADSELRVDRRRLGDWVKAAALAKDLLAHEVDPSGLVTSQLVALLRVQDPVMRRDLAGRVMTEGLSVRQIWKKADELNHRGKLDNAAKVLRKKIGDPLRLLEDTDAVAFLKDEQRLAEEIPYKDRTEIITIIDVVTKQIEQSRTFLDEVRDNLFSIDMERLRRRQT